MALNGGSLTELAGNVYKITWNSGETATVGSGDGTELSIFTQLSSTDGPGSVKGLLGADTGQANDFQLADGTVLPQPLTQAQLYGEYADAWRVTQASSLLDYGAGQTTATFTDPNFPAQPGSLSDFSAAQIAAAAQLVAAAGITNPNFVAAAELDYLETNDPSYISSAAAASQIEPNTTLANITPTPPAPPASGGFDGDQVSLGIYAPALTLNDEVAYSSATVTAGTTTFPDFTALTEGTNSANATVTPGSLAVNGDTMTFLFSAADEGKALGGGTFNGYVLTDVTKLNANTGDILGATLTSTNIAGLGTAMDAPSFKPHSRMHPWVT